MNQVDRVKMISARMNIPWGSTRHYRAIGENAREYSSAIEAATVNSIKVHYQDG